MRRWRSVGLTVVGLTLAAAAVGLVVVLSGAIPLGASSGHWPITRWFLEFTKRRTVAARSLGIEVPPLDDRTLVLRGAGSYESSCRPCHGAPGDRRPVALRNMTPEPPLLQDHVPDWEARELFWIVKNGIKFTGMPGWPVQDRDDEIWSVVAFLLAMPEMSGEEYEALAGQAEADRAPAAEAEGEPAADAGGATLQPLTGEAPEAVGVTCSRCHGSDGLGREVGAFPRLARQSPEYLRTSLRAYAAGTRSSGIMQPVAAALSDDEILEVAGFYGRRAAVQPERGDDTPDRTLGETIARGLDRESRIPVCEDCHGLTRPAKPDYPRLAGQHPEYLVQQLRLFRAGIRGGTAHAHLMEPVASRLTPEQMRAVASFYSSLE